MSENILQNSKCRACFNPSKVLNPLVAKTKVCVKSPKTFGELLEEVTKIDKASEVNDKLLSMLNEKSECLEETQIDLKPCIDIQLGSIVEEPLTKNLDCFQEPQIDIKPCIEIKVENNEWEPNRENMEYTVAAAVDMEQNLEVANLTDAETLQIPSEGQKRKCGPEARRNLKQFKINNDDCTDAAPSDELFYFSSEMESSEENEVLDIAVKCIKCSKILKNSKLLAIHKRISHMPEERKCSCNLCGKTFTRNRSMYRHMETFHGTDTTTLINRRFINNGIRAYKCDKCSKRYAKKESLFYHAKLKHSPTKKVTKNGIK